MWIGGNQYPTGYRERTVFRNCKYGQSFYRHLGKCPQNRRKHLFSCSHFDDAIILMAFGGNRLMKS